MEQKLCVYQVVPKTERYVKTGLQTCEQARQQINNINLPLFEH
jgi:hypothetical protein